MDTNLSKKIYHKFWNKKDVTLAQGQTEFLKTVAKKKLLFSNPRKESFQVRGQKINTKTHSKYLGVIIDEIPSF